MAYLIECLLYNVLDEVFHYPLPDVCAGVVTWLLGDKAVWSRFMCQNEIYPLFDKKSTEGPESFVTELQQVFLR